MVLDSFSALSLASSIVQFVDFSSKLFSASFKIGSSATGVSRETEQIIAQTMDLQKIWPQLSASSVRLDTGIGVSDNALKILAQDC